MRFKVGDKLYCTCVFEDCPRKYTVTKIVLDSIETSYSYRGELSSMSWDIENAKQHLIPLEIAISPLYAAMKEDK